MSCSHFLVLDPQVPAKVLEQVLAHGRLLMYRSGRQIHESAPVRAHHVAGLCDAYL